MVKKQGKRNPVFKPGSLLRATRKTFFSDAVTRQLQAHKFMKKDIVMFVGKGKSHGRKGCYGKNGSDREYEFHLLYRDKVVTILSTENCFCNAFKKIPLPLVE